MKTIFITCFTGLISRNILATEAFERLKVQADQRLVILTPASRAAALEKDFGGPNVIVESVPTPPLRGLDRMFWIMATNLLPTNTRRVQRLAKFDFDRKRFDYWVSRALAAFGQVRLVRRLFRRMSDFVDRGKGFAPLFERFRPNLLFATDVYTPWDVKLMRQARRRGVPIVGMVRSWDNVTSKTLLQFIPERLLVNSERIKAEAVRYGDVSPERISIVGIPHYDRYRTDGRTLRQEFCRKLGLDAGKPFVLFAPPADNYLKADPITPVALEAIAAVGVQVLVRMPLVGDAEMSGYRPPANVVFDAPANSPDFTEVHLSREADRHLADSIYQSAVVVTWASSMIIDAAVFGKPILLVGFDAVFRPYGRSIRRFYDYDHQARILELGGARLAKSPAELTDWIQRYLKDSSLDREGRERIVHEYCGSLDGKAGERLGSYLVGILGAGGK